MPAAKVLGQSPCRAVSPAGRLARPNPTRCRHCGESRPIRARGLCLPCYYVPKIRRRYAPWERSGKLGRSWEYDHEARPPVPRRPTRAAPQSAAKVAVMAARHQAGQSLFHPDDAATCPLDTDTFAAFSFSMLMESISGVSYVGGERPWRANPYRPDPARPAGQPARRAGRHVHLGRFATKLEACAEVVEWVKAGRPAEWRRPEVESEIRLVRLARRDFAV